jgi:hypothetical protein
MILFTEGVIAVRMASLTSIDFVKLMLVKKIHFTSGSHFSLSDQT